MSRVTHSEPGLPMVDFSGERECTPSVVHIMASDRYLLGVFPATGRYKRLKSREGRVNNCPTRLATKVFKRFCKGSTCENDKACKANEICACTEHCGKICIDLRVRIKDHKNSPHGKFYRFIFPGPFSSKFSDLNFASYVLYNLPVLCHVSHTVSLGYLWSIFLVSVNVHPVLFIS